MSDNKCDTYDIKTLLICLRSLGQGNVFTPVFHSVHRGGSAQPAHPTPGCRPPPGLGRPPWMQTPAKKKKI